MTENNEQLSLKSFAKEAIKDTFHVDRNIFRTIFVLLIKPGVLTCEYFRVGEYRYVKPLKLYFIINFIFFLSLPVLNTPRFQIFNFGLEKISEGSEIYQSIIEGEIKKLDVTYDIYKERFNAHVKYNQSAFVFLMIPFYAFLLKLFNWRKNSFFEHIIFSTHFLSFFLLILLGVITLFRIFNGLFTVLNISNGVNGLYYLYGLVISLLVYLIFSVKKYYRDKLWLTILKSVILWLSIILAMTLYVQFLFLYTMIAIRYGY